MLVSTSSGKKWIIPKGIVEQNLSAEESAQMEAFEEAGIEGRIVSGSIGEYQYPKWEGVCTVRVFPFIVEQTSDEYPESGIRKRLSGLKLKRRHH